MRPIFLATAFGVATAIAFGFGEEESELFARAEGDTLAALQPALGELFVGNLKNGDGFLDARSLFERQSCPASTPLRCSGGCCGAVEKCCPTSCCPVSTGVCCPLSMGGCCLSTQNCVPARGGCCDKGAQTCGGNSCYEPGALCCNGGASACRSGQSCCGANCCNAGATCCQGRGCCPNGDKCCPGTCCPPGSECAGGGLCRRLTTQRSTSTRTSTSTRPVTTPPTSNSRPRTTPAVTTPKLTTPKTTATSTGCQTANGIPTPTSANLPVMEFVFVGNGIADDIPVNICLGIRHKLGRSAQEIVLTYAGDGRRCTRARGRQVGCRGCCRGVRKAAGPNTGDSTECDEFPFKSTVEGGTGAWIRCVTGWQNQLQGHYLNSWYSDNNIKAGDQFVVRVSNYDCSNAKSTDLQSCGGVVIRQNAVPGRLGSGAETRVHRSLDNKTNVVVVPFGDLDEGSFQAVARMTDGRLTNAEVLDADGEELAALSDIEPLYTSNGLAVNWELDDYVGGIGLLGETMSQTVNLTWELVDTKLVVPSGGQGGGRSEGGKSLWSLSAAVGGGLFALCVVLL